MTDTLRDRIAQALIRSRQRRLAPVDTDTAHLDADAVMAVLPTYEQAGLLRDDNTMFVTATGPLAGADPPEGWQPVYVKKDTTP